MLQYIRQKQSPLQNRKERDFGEEVTFAAFLEVGKRKNAQAGIPLSVFADRAKMERGTEGVRII
jgi:hypothetical protein